jgi:hypothetical protein
MRFAPRLSPRLLEAIVELDDRSLPIAEVSRRVGRRAVELGLPRPSYGHVRRLVRELRAQQDEARERRDALLEIAGDAVARVITGSYVDPYVVADRVAKANRL